MIKLSIVISYYKAIDNLNLILNALKFQSTMDFEVILSEDDNNLDTIKYIESIRGSLNYSIKHIYQKNDDGFKKNSMLNLAISTASTHKIAFIDGDCIPHKHFVKQYIQSIDSSTFCIGRSVFLDKKTTLNLKGDASLEKLNFFSLLFSSSQQLKDGIYFPLFPLVFKKKGLVGRNWGCARSVLIEINGFDEDYVHAGVGEDSDIEWRLEKHGIKPKSIKNKAIVYHLYHDRWYSDVVERANYNMMKQKMQNGNVQCLNGINKNTLPNVKNSMLQN